MPIYQRKLRAEIYAEGLSTKDLVVNEADVASRAFPSCPKSLGAAFDIFLGPVRKVGGSLCPEPEKKGKGSLEESQPRESLTKCEVLNAEQRIEMSGFYPRIILPNDSSFHHRRRSYRDRVSLGASCSGPEFGGEINHSTGQPEGT
ncbi:MAG: hypothetical protein CMN02_07855 [Roseibacillus sp.]|nr:hypothetical protein [Roseibacillus sp.]